MADTPVNDVERLDAEQLIRVALSSPRQPDAQCSFCGAKASDAGITIAHVRRARVNVSGREAYIVAALVGQEGGTLMAACRGCAGLAAGRSIMSL